MALVATDLGSHLHNNGGGFTPQGTGPFSTGNCDIPANSLVLAVVHCGSDDIASIDSYVLDSPNLTWTKVGQRSLDWTAGNGTIYQLWMAETTSALDDEVITVTHTGINSYSFSVHVRSWTGYDTADPLDGFISGDGTGTTNSLTLTEAPAAADDVWATIQVVGANGDASDTSVAPGSSFTEIRESTITNSFAKWQQQSRTGSTSTAVSWTTSTSAGGDFQDRIYGAVIIRAGGIDGELTETLGALTLESDGSVPYVATVSETLGALTLDSEAGVGGFGSVSKTLAELTLDGAATLLISGTLTKTLEDLVSEAVGELGLTGSVVQTLGDLLLDAVQPFEHIGGANNYRYRLRKSRLGREKKGRIGPANATVNRVGDVLDHIGRRAARVTPADVSPDATNAIGRFDGLDYSPQSRHVKTRGRKSR